MKTMNNNGLKAKLMEGVGNAAKNIGQDAATGYCLVGFLYESKVSPELLKKRAKK